MHNTFMEWKADFFSQLFEIYLKECLFGSLNG